MGSLRVPLVVAFGFSPHNFGRLTRTLLAQVPSPILGRSSRTSLASAHSRPKRVAIVKLSQHLIFVIYIDLDDFLIQSMKNTSVKACFTSTI